MNATAGTLKKQHALTFNAHEIKTIKRDGLLWMSTSDLRQALEYADEKAVHRIYASHADEFTATMTKVIKVATAGGKQAIRFFSLRGAHLIAMFARTPVAKAFRTWALDILDREVADLKAQAGKGERLNEGDKQYIEALCGSVEFMQSWWARYSAGFRTLNSSVAHEIHDHFSDGASLARTIVSRLGLASKTDYAAKFPWGGDWSDRMLYRQLSKRSAA
ncbi:Bro-N domain-containing protein [Massilia sp. NP310]|uniref:BRO-N domain-containing protein n=1 Tax=Massilia sp. NP310 TaxID=2861282 RepID=UPI001C6357A9|nr:Bro-N domain-containing protein [Massilia sp. NP310]QYG01882.1 Bro-N domain-containing protein [Massilia sp. NP310]